MTGGVGRQQLLKQQQDPPYKTAEQHDSTYHFNKTNFANFNPNYQSTKRQIPTKKVHNFAKATMSFFIERENGAKNNLNQTSPWK